MITILTSQPCQIILAEGKQQILKQLPYEHDCFIDPMSIFTHLVL